MAKNARVQMTVDPKLKEAIAAYQAKYNVSQSRACQELVSRGVCACRDDQQGEGEGSQYDNVFVTTALKELLKSSYATQALLNIVTGKELLKTRDKNNQPYDAKRLSKQARQLAEKAVAKVMDKIADNT